MYIYTQLLHMCMCICIYTVSYYIYMCVYICSKAPHKFSLCKQDCIQH